MLGGVDLCAPLYLFSSHSCSLMFRARGVWDPDVAYNRWAITCNNTLSRQKNLVIYHHQGRVSQILTKDICCPVLRERALIAFQRSVMIRAKLKKMVEVTTVKLRSTKETVNRDISPCIFSEPAHCLKSVLASFIMQVVPHSGILGNKINSVILKPTYLEAPRLASYILFNLFKHTSHNKKNSRECNSNKTWTGWDRCWGLLAFGSGWATVSRAS